MHKQYLDTLNFQVLKCIVGIRMTMGWILQSLTNFLLFALVISIIGVGLVTLSILVIPMSLLGAIIMIHEGITSIEFHENPFKIFHKIYYDDTTGDPSLLDLSTLVGSCVRLVVVKKTDFYKFDRFVDKLYDCNLIELKIIEDFSEFETEAMEDEKLDIEDTMTVLSDFVDTVSTDLDKDKIKNLLRTLYIEAQHVSV